MKDFPESLRASIPPELIDDALAWWQSLTESDRSELVRLCDARREIFLFETVDGSDAERRISGGKFLPHDDASGIEEWGEDYFDTLLSNPELVIVYDPGFRRFHIGCSRHARARGCFAEGRIAAEFRCPLGNADCLMDRIRRTRPAVGLMPLRSVALGAHSEC